MLLDILLSSIVFQIPVHTCAWEHFPGVHIFRFALNLFQYVLHPLTPDLIGALPRRRARGVGNEADFSDAKSIPRNRISYVEG